MPFRFDGIRDWNHCVTAVPQAFLKVILTHTGSLVCASSISKVEIRGEPKFKKARRIGTAWTGYDSISL